MSKHIKVDIDIEKLVDTFIGEWCGTDAAYLIDTDNNPGQRLREDIQALINKQIIEARNNSLLDLEQWVKLHDLDKEMILDGIEHMVKSNLQVPDQPRLDHSDRLTQLRITKKDK